MDKQQAQAIIKNTFESSLDKSGFTGFIKTFLTELMTLPFNYQECSWKRPFDLKLYQTNWREKCAVHLFLIYIVQIAYITLI